MSELGADRGKRGSHAGEAVGQGRWTRTNPAVPVGAGRPIASRRPVRTAPEAFALRPFCSNKAPIPGRCSLAALARLGAGLPPSPWAGAARRFPSPRSEAVVGLRAPPLRLTAVVFVAFVGRHQRRVQTVRRAAFVALRNRVLPQERQQQQQHKPAEELHGGADKERPAVPKVLDEDPSNDCAPRPRNGPDPVEGVPLAAVPLCDVVHHEAAQLRPGGVGDPEPHEVQRHEAVSGRGPRGDQREGRQHGEVEGLCDEHEPHPVAACSGRKVVHEGRARADADGAEDAEHRRVDGAHAAGLHEEHDVELGGHARREGREEVGDGDDEGDRDGGVVGPREPARLCAAAAFAPAAAAERRRARVAARRRERLAPGAEGLAVVKAEEQQQRRRDDDNPDLEHKPAILDRPLVAKESKGDEALHGPHAVGEVLQDVAGRVGGAPPCASFHRVGKYRLKRRIE
eukprot:CAMPEP_0177618674 /NCGR_PEP_ID=MMETSP0419_2-20121207/25738_1 /TAXON_ID=582737 /ORGANISM="Tetraselmis sp., Strain GSL018" /LENGTH=456 /DNA_ID=CAMNT_0019117661 /DNA_START=107 /DNA_END=1478 /DNA_ORIENTATION=+